ncbi:MAG: dienelactone hydrolase family protein, partial [Pirellulales bacterium]|nr:dienelactone hydrolase family protein [Pirellulales bacterium]
PRQALDYAVQAWQLGDLAIVALEGEVCADWGALARSLPATKHSMSIGYANEVSCYIPTARIVQEGGYEGDLAHKVYLLPGRFDPKMEVELTDLIRRAAAQLAGRSAPLEPAPYDRERLLVSVDSSGAEHKITTAAEWEPLRKQIIAHVEQATGPVPGEAFRVPLDLKVLEEVDCGSYVRRKIAYNVDPQDRVESYLLIPKKLSGKTPAILALHGTNPFGKELVVGLVDVLPASDAERTRRQYYGKELAERGYIVLAPDYWYYGLYRGKYRTARGEKYDPHQRGYATAAMKGVWNHMRSIDVLETMPEVDASRIGSIGHSLGGYNTLFLGLFDPRVKVMVSSAGYNAFPDYAASKYGGGDLSNWGIDKHLRRIRTVYGNDVKQVPFDFPELLAALAPRPVFTSAPTRDDYFDLPGVLKCLDIARPVYALFGGEGNLEIQSPDDRHTFPDAQRQAAYEFLDKHLRK